MTAWHCIPMHFHMQIWRLPGKLKQTCTTHKNDHTHIHKHTSHFSILSCQGNA